MGARAPVAALADAFIDLLEAVAHEAPLLLVLEDVHWADPPSRTLALRALRGLRSARVLMIWTCRSDHADASALGPLRATEAQGAVTIVDLDPLSLTEITEMLGLLVASRTRAVDDLAARIHGASGGNPLHAVELLQALRDEGVLTFEAPGEWCLHLERMPPTLELPFSVRRALERRLAHLSDHARNVARVLASHVEPMTPGALLDASREVGGGAAEALTELLQRDVVRWSRDDRLTFAHDTIRDAVRRMLPSADIGRRRRRRWAAWTAAASLVGLLVAGWWAVSRAAGSGDVPTVPAASQGALWARTGPTLYRLRADDGRWLVDDSVTIPRDVTSVRPFVGPGGTIRAYGALGSLGRGPDVVELAMDGIDTVFAGEGDDGVFGWSPDGRHLLLATEDPRHPTWLVEVRRLDLATGVTNLIHRPSHRTWGAVWMPDGGTIAVGVSEPGRPDSILLYDPLGRPRGGLPVPSGRLAGMEGCGARLLVSVLPPGRANEIWLVEPTGASRRLGPLGGSTFRRATCSPDGSLIAILDSRQFADLRLLDVATGEVGAAPTPPIEGVSAIAWTTASFATGPASVELAGDTVRVPWGGEVEAAVTVRLSDGSSGPDPVELLSLDPGVLGVRDGMLVGNAPGITALVAVVEGWMADTVPVRVEGDLPSEAMWADRFTSLGPEVWQPVGYPTAAAEVVDGRPVLHLLGDGVWMDGLYSAPLIDLSRGATVELEFRLPLSRTDRQQLQLCLTDADPPPDPTTGWRVPPRPGSMACVSHPGDELSRFDSTSMGFSTHRGQLGPMSFPGDLPARDWTHLGIQVRPDGTVVLVLNRRSAFTFPTRIHVEPGRAWRILLAGRAVETELLVRHLIVWSGERYSGTGVDGHPGG